VLSFRHAGVDIPGMGVGTALDRWTESGPRRGLRRDRAGSISDLLAHAKLSSSSGARARILAVFGAMPLLCDHIMPTFISFRLQPARAPATRLQSPAI
jgi:hypothetical protein